MIIEVIVGVVVLAAAFVGGVLVGRNNKAKVEAVVAQAKDLETKAESLIKK